MWLIFGILLDIFLVFWILLTLAELLRIERRDATEEARLEEVLDAI
jgi:dolichyl-phosphate-mannose--protein O-mannosyl transferase